MEVQGAFYIMAFGAAISIIVFGIELLLHICYRLVKGDGSSNDDPVQPAPHVVMYPEQKDEMQGSP